MRGQQHRAALRTQFADRLPQRLPRIDVQAGGGFVEEQQLGPSAEGQRELHAPLLSAGQLAVAAVHQPVQPGQRHAVGDAARARVVAAGQVDQLAHLQRVRHGRRLQHHPDAAARGQVLRRQAEQVRLPRLRTLQAQQQADRGGLAGPVRTEQGEHLAGRQRQIQAIERQHTAILVAHALQPGQCRGREGRHVHARALSEDGHSLRRRPACDQWRPSGESGDRCHWDARAGASMMPTIPAPLPSRTGRFLHEVTSGN